MFFQNSISHKLFYSLIFVCKSLRIHKQLIASQKQKKIRRKSFLAQCDPLRGEIFDSTRHIIEFNVLC